MIERTGEIGLRRALGARRRHLAGQVLCESGGEGMIGGIVGASLGIVTVVVVSASRQWTPLLDPWLPFAAPPAGALVGLLAGLHPAIRAARMEPVDALRSRALRTKVATGGSTRWRSLGDDMFKLLAVCSLLAGVLVANGATAAPVGGGGGTAPSKKGAPAVIKVGAASRSVLPTVNGSMDYLDDLVVDPTDPESPGLPIPAWDQGRVAVGNGDANSYWVHDDLEVSAVAFQEQRGKQITVVVAANVYMIFSTDGDAIRAAVDELLPEELAGKVEIAIHGDHNHHGPDTAFDVNHEWYEEVLIPRTTEAVLEAIAELRPARLRVAEGEHYFGLGDGRDPQIVDPSLGVLQATATNGETIATLVFWGNHPEVTLGFNPPADLTEDCAVLGLTGSNCHARNRYFTADFAGWAQRIIEERVGGEALFFNGAVGVLVTPLRAAVWEVTDEAPLGLGLVPPPGAVAPGGGTNYDVRNLRRTYLIGEQLALAALAALEHADDIASPTVSYEVETMYTRMSNIGFRFLLVRRPDGFTGIGHLPALLYNCPAAGPKNDDTCTPDDFATEADPLLGQIRVGDHARTRVAYLRIGPVGMMWIPAEIAPELTMGLPAGYQDHPENWHREAIDLHASGSDYRIEGYVKNRMSGDAYRWVVGLGNDELGYVVPLSDYRIGCVADLLAAPGTCQALHDAGAIEYPDAVAGATCKAITEDPSLLPPGLAGEAIAASCRYGQAFAEADDHYEETNSAGWDLESDIMAAVARLTGNADATEVNPDFPGWWRDHTP